ncbi:MAG TPA: hypothetical protein VGO50_14595 [Pyrinomonadaceae bacterium]|nr:hypothetical protein [Pyrinomonadaceae bacterium]
MSRSACPGGLFSNAGPEGSSYSGGWDSPCVPAGRNRSKAAGFSIGFPSAPGKKIIPFDTAFGPSNMISYELGTSLSFYRATYFDLPAVPTDEADIKIRFDGIRDIYLSGGDAFLADSQEIRFGDHPGQQFTVETAQITFTVRCIAIQQRIFEIVVGTKGSYRMWTQRIKDFHKKQTDDFFNSFSADKVPPAKLVAVSLPADFGAKVENSVFSIKFFDLSMNLPASWHLVTGDMLGLVVDIGQESIKRRVPGQKDAVELSVKNTQELLLITRVPIETGENDAAIEIVAEKMPFPNFLPESISKNIATRFVGVSDSVTKPITPVKFGGIEFSSVEVLLGEKNLKKRTFVANLKGIALEIALLYQKDEDLKTMLDALQTIKINAAK